MKYELDDVMQQLVEVRLTLESLVSELIKAGIIKPEKKEVDKREE